ncbi:MAG: hypothetical protein DI630_16765 [Gordonia sp. (in: high G+C Gram-positive bacteria)]|nr:MAG: hypothetical protein DI630_16765 [Gordonia sp. (in: high G+C Gram-positive bacteria)]
MDKVWLATDYYVDDKLDGCSAAVERMFTRLLAWCGRNNSRGKLPKKPWTFVGLPGGKSAVMDLCARGVLSELPDGTFEFGGWLNWNSKADDLAKRRQADRERKRRQRDRDADESRDQSRDVTPTEEKRREENKSVHVTSTSHVSNASDPEMPPTDRPSGPPIKPDAARMVREIIPSDQPSAVKSALRIKASEMLVGGTDPEIVRAALHEWMTRTAAPKRSLTKSERQFVELELMKDKPDPVALRQLGIDPTPTTNLRAINGGAQ